MRILGKLINGDSFHKGLIRGTRFEAPARRLIDTLRRTAPNQFLSDWNVRVQREEKATAAILRRFIEDGWNCLDIGAHKGSFLSRYLELSPSGRHFAFEPLPELAALLRGTYPGVEIHECALSDENGKTAFFHVPEMLGWSGLRKKAYPREAHPREIQVTINRLDDLLPRDLQVHFMKIDVEGAEHAVLRGSRDTISRCRPFILFEHAHMHAAVFGTTPDMIHGFFQDESGYGVYSLLGAGPLTREEFNEKCRFATAVGYGVGAELNFLALPLETGC